MRLSATIVSLIAAIAALPVQAQNRPDVTRMTCTEARDLVLRTNGVVVTTGPRTYQRYVANHRGCEPQEYHLRPSFTPTLDEKGCRIGYTCETYNFFSPSDDD